ncbi:MAG: hypothetical protein AAGA68_26400 [Pseudomonadota bacterium]
MMSDRHLAVRRLVASALLLSASLPTTSHALTVAGFKAICEAATVACDAHPMLNAYVGGSLDMIATLDERTSFLGEVYCRAPQELFDVAAIIRYVEHKAPRAQANANAMTLVVAYLVEKGGC